MINGVKDKNDHLSTESSFCTLNNFLSVKQND